MHVLREDLERNRAQEHVFLRIWLKTVVNRIWTKALVNIMHYIRMYKSWSGFGAKPQSKSCISKGVGAKLLCNILYLGEREKSYIEIYEFPL